MKIRAVAIALPLMIPAAASAQIPQDTFRLRAVVVTAARLPTPVATAPGAVTVVTGASLRERGIEYVADALRTVPGVSVAQSAGPGALTSVFMRGGESDYVQVLVDGVQVNDPGGAYNWAHLRTEEVERIEVVRGPASVLYGSDAVAGVVQIFTRAGGAPRVSARFTGERGDKRGIDESFYNRSYELALTGSTQLSQTALSYGVTAARADADGLFPYNSAYDNTGVSGRVQLAAPRYDVAVNARTGDNEYHYPTSGSGALVDRNQFAVTDSRSLGVDAGVRIVRPFELRVLATEYASDGVTRNPPDAGDASSFMSENSLARRSVDVRLNARLPLESTLTVGADVERQHGATFFVSTSDFGTFSDSTDDARRNTGWYGQLHAQPARALSATLGARLDDNSAFGTFHTGRVAASWLLRDDVRIRAAAGTAFKEPTFFENFATGFARGNPELEPETSTSWEIGAEHTLHARAITLGATWFDQRFRNLIQFTFDTPTPDAPNFLNVGAARARGLELEGQLTRARVDAYASYTLTATTTTDEGFGNDLSFQRDRPLLRRPRHQAALGASVAVTDALRLTADARYVGTRDDIDFTDAGNSERVTLPDYTRFDAGVAYSGLRLGPASFVIAVRVRNAFNEDYQEIYNFPTEGRVWQMSCGPAFNFALWPF